MLGDDLGAEAEEVEELLLGDLVFVEDAVHAGCDVVVDEFEDREEELFFRRKILVDGTLPNVRAHRNVSDAGRGVALLREDG